jgi:hypothetical protein
MSLINAMDRFSSFRSIACFAEVIISSTPAFENESGVNVDFKGT